MTTQPDKTTLVRERREARKEDRKRGSKKKTKEGIKGRKKIKNGGWIRREGKGGARFYKDRQKRK